MFNPPFGKIVQTYVSKTLVHRHFPESHKCHKIFRQMKLVIKVSNGCMVTWKQYNTTRKF